jgi:hypothetical protein
MTRCALIIALAIGFALVAPAWAAEKTPDDPAGIEFFENKVRPALVQHCGQCHGAEKQEANLQLDRFNSILKGGDQGPAVVPGDADSSLLIKAIGYADLDLQMPPKGKLPAPVIADLTRWVKIGAPGPKDDGQAASPHKPAFNLDERRKFWAFQPLKPAAPPEMKNKNWAQSTIDRFILARLEAAGLAPTAEADPRTMIRRLSFDLLGLPPTAEEVEEFVRRLDAATTPEATNKVYSELIDQFLASPRFGERWARHWLDLVRYAETRGHEFDYLIPNAWQYRDYVIRALNADVPYDQFVTEHIAGDLMNPPRLNLQSGFNESILGTGFWCLGEEVHSPVDICADEMDRIDNKIDVMTKTFLGLTVACARCHDHKFDAISTKDYYALGGFLLSASYRQAPFETMEHNRRVAEQLRDLDEASRPKVVQAVAESQQRVLTRLANYLLAAREQIRRKSNSAKTPLDEELLAKWVDHLKKAAKDTSDPFHLWARVAGDHRELSAEQFVELLKPLATDAKSQIQQTASALKAVTVAVDYGQLDSHDWLQDGHSFGPRPVQPGDIRLSSDPRRPIAKIFSYAAAEIDPRWNGLKLAPGTETDAGRVNWLQAGQMLRTPTFTVTRGRLAYLVRGSGHAFASVEQHRMINGPLHGALVKSWKGTDKFQWIEHDLSAYKGRRVHIEFSPQDPADKDQTPAGLAIRMIVDGDSRPADIDGPNPLLVSLLNDQSITSPETLASAYQRLLTAANDRLAKNAIHNSDNAVGYAAIAQWMVSHPDLVTLLNDRIDQRLMAASQPFIDQQAKLVADIQRVSHTAPVLLDGNGVDGTVLIRGNHRTPGEASPRRFLEAIAGAEQRSIAVGSGRLELAHQMTNPAHPQVPRVIVNRVWHHLFGRGLVASVDNFGVLGEEPSHPELLDFLAGEFVREGWSIKRLIRQIVLSRTYRMASTPTEPGETTDPQNRLLHRMNLKRLEGEAIRDSILAISGRLNETMYGPSVPVHLTAFMDGRGKPASGSLDGDGRRSIYIKVRRNFLSPMFQAFDFPTPFTTIGRRSVSNVPAQALVMMNSPLVVSEAKRWAQRVLSASEKSNDERIDSMYVAAFARQPIDNERRAASAFLDEQAQLYGCNTTDVRVWTDLAHVLMNVKEFIYVN